MPQTRRKIRSFAKQLRVTPVSSPGPIPPLFPDFSLSTDEMGQPHVDPENHAWTEVAVIQRGNAASHHTTAIQLPKQHVFPIVMHMLCVESILGTANRSVH